jgi:hypothetical protein
MFTLFCYDYRYITQQTAPMHAAADKGESVYISRAMVATIAGDVDIRVGLARSARAE